MSTTDSEKQVTVEAPATNEDAEGTLPLVIPEGIRYNCQGCGRCCSGWAVGLTDEDYDRVKDVDWGALHPDLKDKELFVSRREEFKQGLSLYPQYTKARPDGTCPFLIDNLCFIHSKFGEPTKPGMCKLFPYTFVPTPSGIYVGVVYNSMASVRNLGDLLSNQRPMLEETWRLTVNQERAQGRASQQESTVAASVKAADLKGVQFNVNLVPGVALSWDEYLHIDKKLISVIQSVDYKNVFDIFMALGDVMVEALRLKNKGADLSQLASFQITSEMLTRFKDESPTIFENLLFNLLCYRNFEWPLLRKQYADRWAAANKSPLTEPKIFNSGMRAVVNAKVEFPYLGIMSLGQIHRYKVRPFSNEINEFFRRYLYLKIFSKTFCGPPMSGLSMIAGYNNLVANFLSALCYAKAQAMSHKVDDIKIADLYEAYFLLDKEVVQLSQLPKDKVQFYDSGFSSPRLFSRLLMQMASEVKES
ncbi:MAG TPA: YkgJ family cysteine cluster protein [Candidatus Obscuribacterales bacterium]